MGLVMGLVMEGIAIAVMVVAILVKAKLPKIGLLMVGASDCLVGTLCTLGSAAIATASVSTWNPWLWLSSPIRGLESRDDRWRRCCQSRP